MRPTPLPSLVPLSDPPVGGILSIRKLTLQLRERRAGVGAMLLRKQDRTADYALLPRDVEVCVCVCIHACIHVCMHV